jgi:hypothetical protein
MASAVDAYAPTIPIGGFDLSTHGSLIYGYIYRSDLEAVARSGYEGLYDVVCSLPATADTRVDLGRVAVLQTTAGDGVSTGDWIITVVD